MAPSISISSKPAKAKPERVGKMKMLAWLRLIRALGGILRSSHAPKRLPEKAGAVLAGSVLADVSLGIANLKKEFKLSA